MNSWFVWTAFVLVAAALGLIAYCFSLRVLRVAAAFVALVTAAYLIQYGWTHPAKAPPGSLSGAFTQGADELIRAFFHLRPAPSGPDVPGSGWIGWLVIAVLLVIGYRGLEALSQRCHARSLDTSELTRGQQTDSSGDSKDAQTGVQRHAQQTDSSGDGKGALTDAQRHDRLAAELKFWLPAVEVRAPAIFPGGSRSSALASIAEASGVNGSGLAGAVIRFFGMLWPSPRRVRVRVWVKGTAVPAKVDALTRVAVCLDDPGTGASIGTKTVAADSLDNAACVAAGYIARRIFAGDPTAPPWSTGVADGGDLAAMLLARHVRVFPETEKRVNGAWRTKIKLLEQAAWSTQCAGVVRYELAHLYDLTGDHFRALELHANNREQYPRFYRGRYRLAMSLEMIASLDREITKEELATFDAVLRILHRWDGTQDDKSERCYDENCKPVLCPGQKSYLLKAAREELEGIRRYLTLQDVIWTSFWHRDERGVLKPYWRLRHRQSFHDGVYFAQLLVVVRQALNKEEEEDKKKKEEQDASSTKVNLPHARKIMRIATTIAGDSSYIEGLLHIQRRFFTAELLVLQRWYFTAGLLGILRWPGKRPEPKSQPMDKRRRTRFWPRRYSTPSWPAAYNLACVYAAICAHHNRKLKAYLCNPEDRLKADKTRHDLERFVGMVVTSLEFAITNPECEMERPWEWISNDPDFICLHPEDRAAEDRAPGDHAPGDRAPDGHVPDDQFSQFRSFLAAQKRRDYPPPTKWTAHF